MLFHVLLIAEEISKMKEIFFPDTKENRWRAHLLRCSNELLQHYIRSWNAQEVKSDFTSKVLRFAKELLTDRLNNELVHQVPPEYDITRYESYQRNFAIQ